MFHEIFTYSMKQFRKEFPNIEIPKEVRNDNSYYVRIGHQIGKNGVEIEYSPDPNVWKYVK